MTQLTDKIFEVEVPVDAFGFCINSDNELGYYANIEYFDKMHYIPLPPGPWRFLFTTKAATEEDARKMVGRIHVSIAPSHNNDFAGDWDTGYVDYENRGEYSGWGGDAGSFLKALDSLRSLLLSKNLDPKNNYALIEKESYDE